jgi:hypothetical protein
MRKTEIESFVKLVEQMRKYQKEYFKNRQHTSLRYAKDFENKVDKALLEMATEKERNQNPTLF